MKNFESGVSFYTKGSVDIMFPEDDVCCHWCPMLAPDYRLDREYCKRTGEFILAPKAMIGFNCPLRFEKEESNV